MRRASATGYESADRRDKLNGPLFVAALRDVRAVLAAQHSEIGAPLAATAAALRVSGDQAVHIINRGRRLMAGDDER